MDFKKAYEDALERAKGIYNEWSAEDENKIESIKGLITMGKFVDTNTIRTIWKLLDSLRPQPHWKPSEEQMKALENVIKCELSAGLHTRARILQTLQNDLKSYKS